MVHVEPTEQTRPTFYNTNVSMDTFMLAHGNQSDQAIGLEPS